jgi:hypothetical protein
MTVIHLVGERQWEDVNWNSQGYCTCVNTELGTWFMWAVDEKLHAPWTHWVLKQYADQGSSIKPSF